MINPIYQLKDKNASFTFFHTHVLDQKVLSKVIASKKNVEIDVSISDGKVYVGHPLSYYRTRKLPDPTNVELEEIIKQAEKANLYLVFDCKHVKTLPKIQEMIQKYGSERCLLHAFVKELSFKPWPPKVVEQSEESWPDEEIPLEELLKVKAVTGVPIIGSCHGVTLERLEWEESAILKRIVTVARDKLEVVNLFLPPGEVMPLSFSRLLLEQGIIPLASDRVPLEQRPTVYLGASDDLSKASGLIDFS